MANQIVTNNLKKILAEKKMSGTSVMRLLKKISYPVKRERFYDLMHNRREIYFGEAIFIAEVLEIKDYNDLVNGNVNQLKTVE